MPVYEYRCNQCQRKFSRLILTTANATVTVVCGHCDSNSVTKLISTVVVHRSDASRLADLDVSKQQGDDFYRDRRNVGLWAQSQLQRRGIEPGSQFEEIVEKARTGKFLDEIG